jgi:hypothetical protein
MWSLYSRKKTKNQYIALGIGLFTLIFGAASLSAALYAHSRIGKDIKIRGDVIAVQKRTRQYRDEDNMLRTKTKFICQFQYEFDGSKYGGTFTARRAFSVGDVVAVWIEPEHPSRYALDSPEEREGFNLACVMVFLVLIGPLFSVLYFYDGMD